MEFSEAMVGTSVIKQLPAKDLRGELGAFISGVNRQSPNNQEELIRKGFSLLRCLPSSREAVFEYFGSIFDKYVLSYMNEVEGDGKSQCLQITQPKEDAVIDEIHNSLCNFISNTPVAWAVLISKWSLTLLGNLSVKYSERGRAPVNGLLSDSLQKWLSCKATRSLLDVNDHCFSLVVNTENEAVCMNTLIEICVTCSPAFDWVVAHIGSCFPRALTIRVLAWGLNDFCHDSVTIIRPKLISVVGILIYLARSHFPEISKAMLELFEWSLGLSAKFGEGDNNIKGAAVPFLMQLASYSPVLRTALSDDTLHSLNPDLFKVLMIAAQDWLKYTGSRQALLDLLIHLILTTEDSTEHIIELLLSCTENEIQEISSTAEEILELLIKELDVSVRVNGAKVPLLDCILKNFSWVLPFFLSDNVSRVSTAVTVISLIGQQQPGILAKCVSYILLRSNNDDHLASVVKLIQGYKTEQVLSPAIALSVHSFNLSDDLSTSQKLWVNLTKLQKWETSGTLISLPMQEAVWENLISISELLIGVKEEGVAHSMADVIRRAILGSKAQPSVHLTNVVVQATIAYFYVCLIHSDGIKQLKGLRMVSSLLTKLCQGSAAARTMAIRELLESALFQSASVLFGAVAEPENKLIHLPTSLLRDNHKQGTTTLLAQRHSSVFHAGVIGSGKRKAAPTCPTSPSKVTQNTHFLISALKSCCMCENPQGTLDAVISMALLLVELISPDVMYNGLPWPEEEFCKVTVERDLYIRRVFDNMPLLWSLLDYIAYHRPALCYCSVLLRALIATLLGQWSASNQQGRGPGHNVALITTTTRVLQLMALGQLLPPPLNVLSDIIQILPPIQVVLLLRDCVWNYMRDNVPSPAFFTRDSNGAMWRDPATSRPPKQYTETLRLVMQRNIATLGPLYNILFVHDLMEED